MTRSQYLRQMGFGAAAATLLFAGGRAAAPGDAAQAAARLAQVRSRIAALTARLADELAQRDSLAAHLRESELAVTSVRQKLEALHADELAAHRRRAELDGEQQQIRARLRSEQTVLAGELRAAYIIGREEPLKLLIDQGDPARLGRTLTYYGYFTRARREKIAAIRQDAQHLQQLTGQIDEQSGRLESVHAEADRELAGLQRARSERTASLHAIAGQMSGSQQQLERLQREERAVESLVADLSQALQGFALDPSRSFEQMRGALPWPVAGRVSARYQEPRAAAEGIRWNGVMIEAERGAKVRAAYYGRVVYADWLQGLGLLIIIGHSGGYMTLYGHAEVLYKSVGDQVAPGDVIAALGDSTGAAPQLYFEIREGRKTVDPRLWLRRKP